MKLIYIVFGKYFKAKEIFHQSLLGSIKDIDGRIQYFEDRKDNFEFFKTINVSLKVFSIKKGIKKILRVVNYNPDIIFFDKYPLIIYLIILKFFKIFKKKKFKIIVRSHNAELFHRFDMLKHCFEAIYYFSTKNYKINTAKFYKFYLVRFFKILKNLFSLIIREIMILLTCDLIISNTKWEKDNYWSKFTKDKVTDLNPILSNNYKNQIISLKNKIFDETYIVLPCSVIPNEISEDQILSLIKHYNFFKEKKLKIIITGNHFDWFDDFVEKNPNFFLPNFTYFFSENMTNYPNLLKFNLEKSNLINEKMLNIKNFYELIINTSNSLIISQKGFGFKNKILELIEAEHKIFVSKNIFKQQEKEIRKNLNLLSFQIGKDKFNMNNIIAKKKTNKILYKNYYKKLDKIIFNEN